MCSSPMAGTARPAAGAAPWGGLPCRRSRPPGPRQRGSEWQVQVNVLPSPSTLTSRISPPSNTANSRLMPAPVRCRQISARCPRRPAGRPRRSISVFRARYRSRCLRPRRPPPGARDSERMIEAPAPVARPTRTSTSPSDGELEGVRDQVLQHLLQSLRVAVQDGRGALRLDLEWQALRFGHVTEIALDAVATVVKGTPRAPP